MANINSIRGAVHVGPTQIMALSQPFVSQSYPKVPGVPLGIDEQSKEIFCFDPWEYRLRGLANSAFGMVIADKGGGKSSLLKILTVLLMIFTAGDRQMRVLTNDYKPEGQGSEYGLLTKALRCERFAIADMSINPLEASLFRKQGEIYELGVVHVLELIIEFLHGKELVGSNAIALRVALSHMVENYQSEVWSIHLFDRLLRSIDEQQIKDYFVGLDKKLYSQMEERVNRLKKGGQLRSDTEDRIAHLSDYKTNYNVSDIQTSGLYLASLLEKVIYGKYGHMFGNNHSMYGMLTQRMVTLDWRGVDPEAERLMRTILTTIKTSAIENNNLDLLPHIELDDEKHKAMDDLVYAKSHSYFSEIARGTHTCNLSATHRLDSIRKGGVGSELYSLGETIINNLGFIFIGRQSGGDSVLSELRSRYNLTESETMRLPTMPDYTFLFKAGINAPARFVRIVAPTPVLPLLSTDSSTERMLDRVGLHDEARIADFAARNGLVFRPDGA